MKCDRKRTYWASTLMTTERRTSRPCWGKMRNWKKRGSNGNETEARQVAIEILLDLDSDQLNVRQAMLRQKQAFGSGIDPVFPTALQINQHEREHEGNHKGMKNEYVSQGGCMDTKRTWNCRKCGASNEEAYKFCMERAGRNPKRHIEETATASSEPPPYR